MQKFSLNNLKWFGWTTYYLFHVVVFLLLLLL